MKKNEQKDDTNILNQHEQIAPDQAIASVEEKMELSSQENLLDSLLYDEELDPNHSVSPTYIEELTTPDKQNTIVFKVPITQDQIRQSLKLDQSIGDNKVGSSETNVGQIMGIGRRYKQHQVMVIAPMIGLVKRLFHVQLKD